MRAAERREHITTRAASSLTTESVPTSLLRRDWSEPKPACSGSLQRLRERFSSRLIPPTDRRYRFDHFHAREAFIDDIDVGGDQNHGRPLVAAVRCKLPVTRPRGAVRARAKAQLRNCRGVGRASKSPPSAFTSNATEGVVPANVADAESTNAAEATTHA